LGGGWPGTVVGSLWGRGRRRNEKLGPSTGAGGLGERPPNGDSAGTPSGCPADSRSAGRAARLPIPSVWGAHVNQGRRVRAALPQGDGMRDRRGARAGVELECKVGGVVGVCAAWLDSGPRCSKALASWSLDRRKTRTRPHKPLAA
jgi:hypothetical protein